MTKPRVRTVKGTDETSYLLEKVPRQLFADAQSKCRQESPPTSLKWRILQLLTEWTYPPRPTL